NPCTAADGGREIRGGKCAVDGAPRIARRERIDARDVEVDGRPAHRVLARVGVLEDRVTEDPARVRARTGDAEQGAFVDERESIVRARARGWQVRAAGGALALDLGERT